MSTAKRNPEVPIPVTELSGYPDIRFELDWWVDYPIEGLATCSYREHCTRDPQPDCRVTMQRHTGQDGHLHTRCPKHQEHWEKVRHPWQTPS